MKLSLNIAKKLAFMLSGGEIPASTLKQDIISRMYEDKVVLRKSSGKSKHTYYILNKGKLADYLRTDFGINDLEKYIETSNKADLTRSEAIKISSNSKIKNIRTFKGFLVNTYAPINAVLNNKNIVLAPTEGIFTFIYDFENFSVPENITIVGVENAENFRWISQQKPLFEDIEPLFVSRYPQNQSKDLIKWLKKIPNNYVHFGDFDFAGINIFLNEYQQKLGEKARFFIPENIEKMIKENGNTTIYDTQIRQKPRLEPETNEYLHKLVALIHQYKKGLEQEFLINIDPVFTTKNTSKH